MREVTENSTKDNCLVNNNLIRAFIISCVIALVSCDNTGSGKIPDNPSGSDVKKESVIHCAP